MCFPMCSFLDILNSLPFLLLLTMPLYGSVLGITYALKFSLILYAYAGIQSYLPNLLGALAGGATLLALMVLPLKFLPEFVITFYEFVINYSNPLLILVEAKQLVLIVRIGTRWMVDLIDENPILAKTLISSVSVLSYSICILVLPKILQAQIEHFSLLVVLVMTLQGILFCATLYKPSGVISDAALSCLLSTLTLWIIIYESQLGCNASYVSPSTSLVRGRSFFELLLHLPQISYELAHVPVVILKSIFSFPFWALLAIRILSVVRSLRQDDDDLDLEDDEDEDDFLKKALSLSRWRKIFGASFLVKLVAIFAYTQLVSRQISFLSSTATVDPSPTIWCGGIKLDRLIQSFSFSSYSLWLLYIENDDDVDW